MLRMNDDFTVVMHVISKDKTSASHLRADLLLGEGATKDLSGLHVTAREIKPSSHPGSMREARVRCTGYDRPGIVYQVTEVLASAGFNIDELTTDTIRVSGKDGKTRPFFLLEGVVTAPEKVPIQAFEKKLEGLRSSLDAKITVTRLSQAALNIHRGRVRATEHAPSDPCRLLARVHGFAEIVECRAGVQHAHPSAHRTGP
jgi:glycine cleavage system regulatory protein